ncbi:MAG: class IV adenylate cyclase [Chloroflexi bacterium]|nr:class IV adenylate cyclase [Chloroflexota bacterium]
MAELHQEIEVKFHISSLADIEMRLRKLKAHLPGPRTREVNLRFDTPDGSFQRAGKVLRLRRDGSIHLTYKDGSRSKDGAISRREIEFEVSDFETARCFIEALGYQVVFLYEKYRTTYELDGAHVMLDETPIGSFVEIEGELDSLRPVAKKLGLDWNTAIPASYHALFERVCKARGFTFRDLSFENFEDIEISSSDLGVKPAGDSSANISMNTEV